ncbi:MAG: beta-N-acetylhexosaminidase, partial [Streptomycetaceae bacterium]|nr:beta-N-acetylhexosaminidase [Streptomycetaceae bacterium]
MSATTSFADVVPAPAAVQGEPGVVWVLGPDTRIRTTAEAARIGDYLASLLRPATGYALPVEPYDQASSSAPGIALVLDPAAVDDGEEGYRLDVTASGVVIRAAKPAGLFRGVQTLRQLVPAEIESGAPAPRPCAVPGGSVTDRPRYAYRGMSLDIARHFFTP